MPELLQYPEGTAATSIGLAPSGDTTGVTDLANIVAALATQNVVQLQGNSVYYVNNTITLSSGQAIIGGRGRKHVVGKTEIILPATFAGTSLFKFTAGSTEQRIEHLSIDGSLPAANSIVGINANAGEAQYVQLDDILIYGAGFSNGIATNSSGAAVPNGWRCSRVVVYAVGSTGILLRNGGDHHWTDCQTIQTGIHGWSLNGMGNSKFTACRADYATSAGLNITGVWATGAGSGGCQFDNFSTDRNALSGVLIDATGTGIPFVFTGLMLRRDGSAGTRAGLYINGAGVDVIVNGMTIWHGKDDAGTGTDTPLSGVNCTSATGRVQITGASITLASGNQPIVDGGGNTNFAVLDDYAAGVLSPSGDTTGVTDLANINNLLADNGICNLAAGTFYIGNNSILLPAGSGGVNIVLQGAGMGKTTIRWDGVGSTPCIKVSNTTTEQVVATISDLYLRDIESAASTGTGILADYFTANSVIQRVRIDGTTNHPLYGIRFGVASNNTHYYAVRDCRVQVDGTNAIGIDIKGGTSLGNAAHSGIIENCRVQISSTDSTQIGINVGARAICVIHPDIESFMGTAIRVNKTAGGVSPFCVGDACTILNPYLETGSVAGGICIQIDANVLGAYVVGGTILASDAAATPITDNGTNTKIVGIRFVNSANTGGIAYDQFFAQSDATAGKIIQVTNTSSTNPITDATVRVNTASANDPAVGGRVTGDAANRWRLTGAPRLEMGDGSGPIDLGLARAGSTPGLGARFDVSTNVTGATAPTTFVPMGLNDMGDLFLAPTGAYGQTLRREDATANTAGLTTSGTVYLTAIYLPAGLTVGHIAFMTGITTLKTGGTHGWYVLCDSGRVVRAATADQTDAATVWGTASTVYSLATNAYVTQYSGLYYVGIMVANSAGTQPNLFAGPALSNVLYGLAPIICGATATVSQTTAPATDGSVTIGAITADASKRFWAYVTA